jgi:hypothetical protein
MFTVPAQVAIQAVCTHQEVAAATTLYLTSLPLGGAVGSAVGAAIWNNRLIHYLNEFAPSLSPADQETVINSYITASTAFPMGTDVRLGIAQAYSETLKILCIVGVVVAALGIPAALFMENFKIVDRRNVLDRAAEYREGDADTPQQAPEKSGV